MRGNAVIAILSLVIFTGPASAFASSATRCQVMTIEASNTNTGIDSRIKKYAGIFKKPPFAKFNSFELVNHQVVDLDAMASRSLTLPDAIGGTLKLRHEEKGKFQLTLTLARAGQKPVSIDGLASPGAPLFAAGLKSPKGVWIFGIACEKTGQIIKY